MLSRALAILAALAALSIAGCGSSGGDAGPATSAPPAASTPASAAPAKPHCLTASQVDAQVNRIANGLETSAAQVSAEQRAIRAVRGRACP